MTVEQAHQRAIRSLLDVVEELAQGLAAGATPSPEWAAIVNESFDGHRAELRDPEGHEPEAEAEAAA